MLNRTVLIGRLTKDPELRYTPNNVAVSNFTLAVGRQITKEGQPDVDFINIVVWGKTAENVKKYVDKGSLVGVDGRIQVSSYQAQDGSHRTKFEVVAETVQFLDSKKEEQPTNQNYRQQEPYQNYSASIEIADDDLPF